MTIKQSKAKLTCAALLIAAVAMPVAAGAQPTKSYKNPDTGEDCVTEIGSEQSSANYIQIKYKNSCNLTFSIWYETRAGKKSSNGIGPYGTSHMTIRVDEMGGDWWFD